MSFDFAFWKLFHTKLLKNILFIIKHHFHTKKTYSFSPIFSVSVYFSVIWWYKYKDIFFNVRIHSKNTVKQCIHFVCVYDKIDVLFLFFFLDIRRWLKPYKELVQVYQLGISIWKLITIDAIKILFFFKYSWILTCSTNFQSKIEK